MFEAVVLVELTRTHATGRIDPSCTLENVTAVPLLKTTTTLPPVPTYSDRANPPEKLVLSLGVTVSASSAGSLLYATDTLTPVS